MDNLTPEARRETMRRVKAKDTTPERVVRRLVHGLGYRFRLHRRDLPGCPDMVLPRHRVAVFVHGCFWHVHHCKAGQKTPKTNAEYWQAKRERNRCRDARVKRQLRRLGWRVLTVWECQTRPTKRDRLVRELADFLENTHDGRCQIRRQAHRRAVQGAERQRQAFRTTQRVPSGE